MSQHVLKLEKPSAIDAIDEVDRLEIAVRIATGLAARYDGGLYDEMYGRLANVAFKITDALIAKAQEREYERA